MKINKRTSCSKNAETKSARTGFSLLEVILALALSALISGAIATAIQVHLVGLKKQQESIERSHIARNVLEVLATDIRAAMQYKPFETEDVVNVEEAGVGAAGSDAAAAAAAGAGVDMSGGGGTTGGGGIPDQEETASPNQNIQSSVTPLEHPGFYGTQTALVFDISRLPRVDQYNVLVVGEDISDIASDIKTTSYFLDTTGTTSGSMLEKDTLGGLYRRQLDHAVARYANETGGLDDGVTELLATEIVEIAFRYFDGEEWNDEWDSDELGGFPSAVEIVMIVDQERKAGNADYEYQGFDEETMKIYRKVVHLPLAEMLTPEELNAINGVAEAAGDAASGDSSGDSTEDSGGER